MVPPGSNQDRGMCEKKRTDDRPAEGGALNSGRLVFPPFEPIYLLGASVFQRKEGNVTGHQESDPLHSSQRRQHRSHGEGAGRETTRTQHSRRGLESVLRNRRVSLPVRTANRRRRIGAEASLPQPVSDDRSADALRVLSPVEKARGRSGSRRSRLMRSMARTLRRVWRDLERLRKGQTYRAQHGEAAVDPQSRAAPKSARWAYR